MQIAPRHRAQSRPVHQWTPKSRRVKAKVHTVVPSTAFERDRHEDAAVAEQDDDERQEVHLEDIQHREPERHRARNEADHVGRDALRVPVEARMLCRSEYVDLKWSSKHLSILSP